MSVEYADEGVEMFECEHGSLWDDEDDADWCDCEEDLDDE